MYRETYLMLRLQVFVSPNGELDVCAAPRETVCIFHLPVLKWRKALTICLRERSLTRVLGSVTLATDKASKGAWWEEGKSWLRLLGESQERRSRVL